MGKVAIITGVANGIGRVLTENFLSHDYEVAIIDKDGISLQMMKEKYPHLLTFQGDISEKSILDDFLKVIKNAFSSVHVLINNACYSNLGLKSCSYEAFNEVLRVGISAPFYLTQQLMPLFDEGASIINLSSTRAFMSQANTESYSAAKGGITALTHAMSITLAGKVRVNAIAPGWIDCSPYQHEEDQPTELSELDHIQQPVGRVGTPQDIAELALFLASDQAGFIDGQTISIDGGMSKQMIYHNDESWIYKGREE